MCSFGNGVLLEGSVDCVSGEKSFRAKRFVSGLAEVTGQAGAVQPLWLHVSVEVGYYVGCESYLDTSVVTDFNVLNQFTLCYNDTSTFVTSNERELCW